MSIRSLTTSPEILRVLRASMVLAVAGGIFAVAFVLLLYVHHAARWMLFLSAIASIGSLTFAYLLLAGEVVRLDWYSRSLAMRVITSRRPVATGADAGGKHAPPLSSWREDWGGIQ